MSNSVLTSYSGLSSGLSNLVFFAEYVAKKTSCSIRRGTNTVLLHHPSFDELKYIVSDGLDDKEMFAFAKVALEGFGRPLSIWMPFKEYIEIPSDYGLRTVLKGASVSARPTDSWLPLPINIRRRSERCYPGSHEHDYTRAALEDADGKFVRYVYLENDVELGSMTLFNDGTCVGIYDLVVNPEFRKRGIGSDLLNYAKQIAAGVNAHEVVAQVPLDVLDFYKKSGFVVEENITVILFPVK